MSNCDEIEPLLHGLLDDELDAANTLRVEAHLAECPECAALYAQFNDLRSAIRGAELDSAASPALRARVRTALAREVRKPFWQNWARPAGWGGPLIGAALAASAMFAILPTSGETLTAQLVDGHVRSLMANHLMDVVTSDHHVVKPWFAGHVDFSPPIYDLASAGFPLAGGRVDYVDNHPVAAVVYRHGAHVINLFIWPTRAGDEVRQPTLASREGYNLRHWTKNGMSCWAVSDTSPVELARFETLIKTATPL